MTDQENINKKNNNNSKTFSYKCRIRYGSYLFRDLFETDDKALQINEQVIVKSSRDTEMGVVISKPVLKSSNDKICGSVIRRASKADCTRMNMLDSKAHNKHWTFVEEKAAELGLKLRLVNVECLFGEQKVVIHYTADGRVDFRELVHLLARKFRARIEMRQIGPRDCTRLYGGIGTCGLSLCCSSWLNKIEPVTIRMAKEQGQPLNPSKNCGVCGKLKCCLRYELENNSQKSINNNKLNNNQ